jgi:hypothetical protein
MFEPLSTYPAYPKYPITQDYNQSVSLVQNNNQDRSAPINRKPQINYASYDGAKVVYSNHNSIASSSNYSPIASYYEGNLSKNNQQNYHFSYPIPAEVPYFNPARDSVESNKATMGLNASNENMWTVHKTGVGAINWEERRGMAERNMYMAEKNEIRDYLEAKEVVTLSNVEMPKEIIVQNSSIKGKLKLAFNFIDTRFSKTVSNMDSIALNYHDKSKRKFF